LINSQYQPIVPVEDVDVDARSFSGLESGDRPDVAGMINIQRQESVDARNRMRNHHAPADGQFQQSGALQAEFDQARRSLAVAGSVAMAWWQSLPQPAYHLVVLEFETVDDLKGGTVKIQVVHGGPVRHARTDGIA
jgi:hypothetical protein